MSFRTSNINTLIFILKNKIIKTTTRMKNVIILIDTGGNISAFVTFKKVCEVIGLEYEVYKRHCYPMAVYTDKGYIIQKHQIQR